MPPQGNQPENMVPGIAPTPEMPQNPPTFGEVLDKQNTLNASVETMPIDKPTENITPIVAPAEVQTPNPIETAQMPPLVQATDTGVSTPKELVQKFHEIEGMSDDPYAEQEAFKKAQSEYLASIGENIDKAA
jgi:hypothetical protein